MHICPDEIALVAAVVTGGSGAMYWLRWKRQQLVNAFRAVIRAFYER